MVLYNSSALGGIEFPCLFAFKRRKKLTILGLYTSENVAYSAINNFYSGNKHYRSYRIQGFQHQIYLKKELYSYMFNDYL